MADAEHADDSSVVLERHDDHRALRDTRGRPGVAQGLRGLRPVLDEHGCAARCHPAERAVVQRHPLARQPLSAALLHAQVEHLLLAVHDSEAKLVEAQQRAHLEEDAFSKLVDTTCAAQRAGRIGEHGKSVTRCIGGAKCAAEAAEGEHEQQHQRREQPEGGRRRGVVEHRGEHAGGNEDEVDQRIYRPDDPADFPAIEPEVHRKQCDVYRLRRDRHRHQRADVIECQHAERVTAAGRQVRLSGEQQRQARHRCVVYGAQTAARGEPWLYRLLSSGQISEAAAQMAAATGGLSTSSMPTCGTRSIELSPTRGTGMPNCQTNRQVPMSRMTTQAGGNPSPPARVETSQPAVIAASRNE